jgi:hypothetical protein
MCTRSLATMANAYNKYDSLACSEHHGREVVTGAEYEHPDIICPQMTMNRKPLTRPTMTLEKCKTRIREGNRCTIGCKVLDEIRSKE